MEATDLYTRMECWRRRNKSQKKETKMKFANLFISSGKRQNAFLRQGSGITDGSRLVRKYKVNELNSTL